MSTSADLVTWLRGCLDDDQAGAEAAIGKRQPSGTWQDQVRIEWDDGGDRWDVVDSNGLEMALTSLLATEKERKSIAAHIARWDPARVLAEVAAKRAILKLHEDAGASQGYTEGGYGYIDHCCGTCGSLGEYGSPFPCATLRALVEPYPDRPGFDPSWTSKGTLRSEDYR